MKAHPRAKVVALVLLPLLGCGALAWQGAHSPARIIIGKWSNGPEGSTIEFKPDGTYRSLTNPGRVHNWGRYWFLSRSHLQYGSMYEQLEGKPPRPTLQGGQPKFLNDVDVETEEEQVHVFSTYVFPRGEGQIWKRIR